MREAAMTSREVAEAVGAEGTESLERRRARLRRVIQEPSEREIAARELMEVESEIAARDRGALMAEEKARRDGIARAFGSLNAQLEQDVRNVLAEAERYAAAWAKMVERFMLLGRLRGEYDALVDGFRV